jgi:hypothetical protein
LSSGSGWSCPLVFWKENKVELNVFDGLHELKEKMFQKNNFKQNVKINDSEYCGLSLISPFRLDAG